MNMDEKRSHGEAVRHRRYKGSDSMAAHKRQSSIRDETHMAPHPKSAHGEFISGHGAVAGAHGQAPSATSILGSMGIIEDPKKGRDHNMGIPGIISSTSLGPEQRQRLVAGIIESPMEGEAAEGPVSMVQGHDATAYNEGMIHLRGSHFK